MLACLQLMPFQSATNFSLYLHPPEVTALYSTIEQSTNIYQAPDRSVFLWYVKETQSLDVKGSKTRSGGEPACHPWGNTYSWLVTVSVHSLHVKFNCFHFAA